jgi:hypothetical protein
MCKYNVLFFSTGGKKKKKKKYYFSKKTVVFVCLLASWSAELSPPNKQANKYPRNIPGRK